MFPPSGRRRYSRLEGDTAAIRLGLAALVMLCGFVAGCGTVGGLTLPGGFGAGPAQPAGACCLFNGNCIVVRQGECEQQLGTYLGDDFPCGLGPCPG